MNTILVPLDGSPLADRVLPQVLAPVIPAWERLPPLSLQRLVNRRTR